jgi:predicted nucleic acid-binding protein
MKILLMDTGPLVAYLDSRDAEHNRVAASIGDFSGTLCTTGAVITEAMHLLKADKNGPRRLAEFVQATGMHIFESTQPQQLFGAVTLMEKYSDTPMDFADATLVLLSDEVETTLISTLDRRGFGTFRTRKGRSFEILPRR